MKFPTLFGRTPSYQRFQYKPRYYDPQKEEREERERRIREELNLAKEQTDVVTSDDYRSRIKGSFQKARKRAKPSSETNAILLRLAVLLVITFFLIAYLTWGTPAIYGLLLLVPVWFYFRFLKK
jgi:hypothetical protein